MITVCAIDRFDGNESVILEDESGRTFTIPKSLLPAGAREDDIVRVEWQNQGDLVPTRITVDAEASAKRRREAERLRQDLPRGPKGDVSL